MGTAKPRGQFKKMFEELERIVATFEAGEIDLDEALAEFERGLKLVQELKGKLHDIENKVTVLKKKFGDEHAREEVGHADEK